MLVCTLKYIGEILASIVSIECSKPNSSLLQTK